MVRQGLHMVLRMLLKLRQRFTEDNTIVIINDAGSNKSFNSYRR